MSKRDKNCAVVGRMSAALSDMEMSDNAALIRPTKTASPLGFGLSGLGIFIAITPETVPVP